MTFAGSDVSAGIDDLPLTGTASDILLTSTKFASLKKGILPAGYQAQIALQNDQANNISGVTYSLIDENAKLVGSHTLTLATLTNGQKALAPIVAITLNIVGPFEGEDTLFSSGGGSITYQASNFLSVTNTPPSFVAETQFTTELSNSVYGELPSGPNRVNSQTFTIGAPA